MDKYIGNKKSILPEIEAFIQSKGVTSGVFFDAFTGTTNVAQYFKQRGFSIVANDSNEFCYVLQRAYLRNNEFPRFDGLRSVISSLPDEIIEDAQELKKLAIRKIEGNCIFPEGYIEATNYSENIEPLCLVLAYLNAQPSVSDGYESSFFFDNYCFQGNNSGYVSLRGSKGRRNYFTEHNAKKIGVLLAILKKWFLVDNSITDNEFYILLASLIEEVTLVANVNGTFHDFNRKKLYPNALPEMRLKAPSLNIYTRKPCRYSVFCENSNDLVRSLSDEKLIEETSVLYVDPPYNFRQYSAYYHLLNLIATFHKIGDLREYASGLKYVRGQNPINNYDSDYCYKDRFQDALRDLVSNCRARHVVISYYDENNHWSHGQEGETYEGREVILSVLSDPLLFDSFDSDPTEIVRKNYQSQSGRRKKLINELLFYGKRKTDDLVE